MESERVMGARREMSGVREVRGYGYLIGVECDAPAKMLQTRLLDEGIIVGTCSEANTIRLLPPLTVSTEEWDSFLRVFERVLADQVEG